MRSDDLQEQLHFLVDHLAWLLTDSAKLPNWMKRAPAVAPKGVPFLQPVVLDQEKKEVVMRLLHTLCLVGINTKSQRPKVAQELCAITSDFSPFANILSQVLSRDLMASLKKVSEKNCRYVCADVLTACSVPTIEFFTDFKQFEQRTVHANQFKTMVRIDLSRDPWDGRYKIYLPGTEPKAAAGDHSPTDIPSEPATAEMEAEITVPIAPPQAVLAEPHLSVLCGARVHLWLARARAVIVERKLTPLEKLVKAAHHVFSTKTVATDEESSFYTQEVCPAIMEAKDCLDTLLNALNRVRHDTEEEDALRDHAKLVQSVVNKLEPANLLTVSTQVAPQDEADAQAPLDQCPILPTILKLLEDLSSLQGAVQKATECASQVLPPVAQAKAKAKI